MTQDAQDVTPGSASREIGFGPKRSTVIAQRIVREIREQGMAPGDSLPPESEMLKRYGVGRNTLREGLRILEQQGVLTIRTGPRGGPVVTAPDSRHLASTLALLMQFADTPFSTVIETRQLLEPLTARLCAERGDAELVAALRASVDQMGDHLGDRELFLQENHRFHELVTEGSGNPIIGYCINSLHWITDGSVLGIDYPPRTRKSVWRAHEAVCNGIASGDPDRAEEAMRSHMDETLDYFNKHYRRQMREHLSWDMYGV